MNAVSKIQDFELPRVFVVNPDSKHRGELARALRRYFDISTFDNHGEALDALHRKAPTLVIFDDQTKSSSGASLLDTKRRDSALRDIPFIVTGANSKSRPRSSGWNSDIDRYLDWPFKKSTILSNISELIGKAAERGWEDLPEITRAPLKMTVEEYQSIATAIATGEPINYESAEQSCRPLAEAVFANAHHDILTAIQSHHDYTYVHSMRVATLLTLFGYGLGMKDDQLLILSTGGLLHDVGKLVTPETILDKPGKLDADEWVVMKGHVDHSSVLLARGTDISRGAVIIAEQHHEKLDGSGYPLGLKGRELNDLARMSAIVDIFGALTDKRAYKPAFPVEKAFAILEDMTEQIDQHFLKIFKEIFSDG